MMLDVAAIREGLRRGHQGSDGSNATTMNFIVFVDEPGHRAWALERTAALFETHACRLLVLDACTVSSDAHVHTSLAGEPESGVRAERIELPVGGMAPAAIRGMVQSLAVPEIPTTLWWTGLEFVSDPRFLALAELGPNIIVDSSGRVAGDAALRALLAWLDGASAQRVRDLAFMRLSPWQDIVAQFFDGRDVIEDLFSIAEVAIASGSAAEAFYLIGWLASRLEWDPCGRHEFCNRNGETIRTAYERAGDARRIQRVTLTTAGSRFTAEVSPDASETVSLSVAGKKARATRCTPLQNIDNVSLLEKAALTPTTEPTFADSVEMVRRLLAFER